jgi:transposase
MDIAVKRGAGLDVHKETVVACIMGEGIAQEVRTFRTMTNDLLAMKSWLAENGITHVAMESTGIYWKPVFNVLEDGFEVILVNARHIKNVPGRKTDVKDCEWLCKLLRNGLVQGSFIPEKAIRELRDLTRYRKKLIENVTAEKHRVNKVLEDANIKLSSVVTDTFGVSGSIIIDELVKGERTVDELADFAKRKLIKKKDQLKEALVGYVTPHHRFMLKTILTHVKHLHEQIAALDQQVDECLKPYQQEYELLKTIPGVKNYGAASIIAEIGTDMTKFPTEGHVASWAGISPGNNESAGKKKADALPQEINTSKQPW